MPLHRAVPSGAARCIDKGKDQRGILRRLLGKELAEGKSPPGDGEGSGARERASPGEGVQSMILCVCDICDRHCE